MTSAGEAFVIALGRAQGRTRRHLRNLQPADQDDVLSTAIIWCWQNRSTYSPRISLELWLEGAVRDAVKAWYAGEARRASDLLEEIPVPDETLAHVETLSAAREIIGRLSAEDRKIVFLQLKGYTKDGIAKELGISTDAIRKVREWVKQLRHLLPDPASVRQQMLIEPTPRAPDYDEVNAKPKSIDKELAKFGAPVFDGGASTYADDWVSHDRLYAAEEDIRGTPILLGQLGFHELLDYEGNPPERRFCFALRGGFTWFSERSLIR